MIEVNSSAWLVVVDELNPDNAVPPPGIIVFDEAHAEAIAADVVNIVGRCYVYKVTVAERKQFNANR